MIVKEFLTARRNSREDRLERPSCLRFVSHATPTTSWHSAIEETQILNHQGHGLVTGRSPPLPSSVCRSWTTDGVRLRLPNRSTLSCCPELTGRLSRRRIP